MTQIQNNKKNIMLISISVIVMILMITVQLSYGATLTVNASGGADYTKIQYAINNSSAGETILVYSGTYYENVNVSKSLTLKGIDTGGGKPVVDAGDNGNAVTLSAGNSTLEGFSVRNGSWIPNEIIPWPFPNAGIQVISNNNNIKNNTASNNVYGIHMDSSNNNTLSNNTASNNYIAGISLDHSNSNNTLSTNTVSNNYNNGIELYFSSNNTLSNNTASNNSYNGVSLDSSSNNILSNNTISNNSQSGLTVSSSSNNTISNNTISNNNHSGISLSFSSNNTLIGNNVSNNSVGIWPEKKSINNIIYHNIFVNKQNVIVTFITPNSTLELNIWDNGYPSGGNYWDDYKGVDNFSGAAQNQSGSDGIGDTPYNTTSSYDQDRYPLMKPYGSNPSSNSTYTIPIIAGWNLIAVPTLLKSWELGNETLVGDPLTTTPKNCFSSIYRYNTTSKLFEKSYHVDNWGWLPSTGSEGFTKLELGRGYWAWAKSECTITFE